MPDLPVDTLREAVPHLRRPFAPEAVKFRPIGGGNIVAYLDARLVTERLNAVIPDKWETRFELYPTQKQIECFLTVDGLTRSDVGSLGQSSQVDPVKAGVSDALKRAAVHFGIGVSIYALKQVRVSDVPGMSKDSKQINDAADAWLRKGYKAWLRGPGKHFGEPLSHGDVEGAVGDPEADPGSIGEAPEPLSLEVEAARAKVENIYEQKVDGRKLSQAKFNAKLKAATAQGQDGLNKLARELGGLSK
jgi:Rad52/22 family double-strand break repair protein